MVGFIKKERGGAPSISFVTSLEVNAQVCQLRACLGIAQAILQIRKGRLDFGSA